MRVEKWRAIRDAKSLVDSLPKRPIAWGIGGSCITSTHPHDIDLCLIYDHEEDWMRDRKVWLEGWRIPFDLFFYVTKNPAAIEAAIASFGWRGDQEDFESSPIKIKKEEIY